MLQRLQEGWSLQVRDDQDKRTRTFRFPDKMMSEDKLEPSLLLSSLSLSLSLSLSVFYVNWFVYYARVSRPSFPRDGDALLYIQRCRKWTSGHETSRTVYKRPLFQDTLVIYYNCTCRYTCTYSCTYMCTCTLYTINIFHYSFSTFNKSIFYAKRS